MITIIILLVILLVAFDSNALNEDFLSKLSKSLTFADSAISKIKDEWEVTKYPNFLKSCFMHKISWELLKLRFQSKIIDAVTNNKKSKFVISFTGSSVTAGHDSHFNASTPVQTGLIMGPVLAQLDVELYSRNVALGNNPCTPYDVCVKYFAGLDADIVHWEQTYFCNGKPIIEQFVRQASFIPSRPIVVFSESSTGGNWKAKSGCPSGADKPYVLTNTETGLLGSTPLQLASEINRDEFHRAFGFVGDYTHVYHSAGIQTFTHQGIDQYKCHGPYVKEFGDNAASWHPSVLGHRLRASHHSYFWLHIWIDAIKDLRSLVSHRQLDAIKKDIDHHLQKLYGPVNPAKHKSPFPDNATCLTDYEPRSIREASLRDKVIAGLADTAKGDEKDGWRFIIYENIVNRGLVQKSHKQGYKDYKWLLHGNKESGPLSIKINLRSEGPIFLCQTPGIWGKLPSGFDHLWTPLVEVYITYDVKDPSKFTFSKGAATKYELFHDKPLEICGQVRRSAEDVNTKAGSHVLTIVPTSSTKVIVAWVVTS